MGLSFLNKKSWHTGSFQNIEKVWIAEQKQKELETKALEQRKKLKEEKQIEELKKLQVDAGLIPASHLQRLDWMYQGPSQAQSNNAEEFLLGKSVKESDLETDKDKPKRKTIIPVIKESTANFDNETFTKMMEDPLVLIKQEELRARREILDNPVKMREIQEEIEKLKGGKKSKSKKDKKGKKKHKKSSKRTRAPSSSSSESDHDRRSRKHRRETKEKPKRRRHSPSSSSSSEDDHRDVKRKKSDDRHSHSHNHHHHSSHNAPTRLHPEEEGRHKYGLQHRNSEERARASQKQKGVDLGPSKDIYEQRMREKEEAERYKKHQNLSYKNLTEEEKQEKLRKMEQAGRDLEKQKLERYKRDTSRDEKEENNVGKDNLSKDSIDKPKFIQSMQKDSYLESSMDLAERINRNSHYIEKARAFDKHAFKR